METQQLLNIMNVEESQELCREVARELDSAVLLNAIDLVEEYHRGQTYSDKPYTFHLYGCMLKLYYEGVNCPLILTAMLLHDLFEDTDYQEQDKMFIRFGEANGLNDEQTMEIYELVDLLTDRDGKNRFERHCNTYYRIRSNEIATLIKMSDRWFHQQYALTHKGKTKGPMYRDEYKQFKLALYSPSSYATIQIIWKQLDEQFENLKKAFANKK